MEYNHQETDSCKAPKKYNIIEVLRHFRSYFVMSRTIYIYIYIYRSLDYLSITLRYSGLFGLCNSPVQGQVITCISFLFH
ncbi:hypothetical protein ACN42_g2747 [Penicillium freii]|uniref:Uncharacterized protein n=1 Tax=Penicillium freii TaxID=48697 RepID=A0A101MPK2_PENFR|nr:hypothetical protein ACN42_g2747 [Penicillium freii]